jgi:hypothetical protein
MAEAYNPMMNNAAPVAAAPTAAPVAAAPLVAANPTPMPSAAPTMESGGSTSGGGIRGWFGDINILDVTIAAFIVGVGFYGMSWFKFNMMIQKTGYADLSSRVQKLESSAAKKAAAEANAAGSMKGSNRRPMMRI